MSVKHTYLVKLKSYNKKVYLSPQLTYTERETERKILTKRRELISDGVSRSDLKIKKPETLQTWRRNRNK